MLTYDEFVQNHPQYAGLSKATKRKRYDDYVRSTKAARKIDKAPRKTKSSNPDRSSVLRSHLTETEVERIARKKILHDEFLTALLDPFHADPARVPQLDGRETAVYQIKFNVPVASDSNGNAAVVFVPRIQACFAVSRTSSCATGRTIGDTASTLNPLDVPGNMVYDVYNCLDNAGNALELAKWTEGSWCVLGSGNSYYNGASNGKFYGLEDVPQANAMSQQFTDYIVTAAGMSFQYTANPLTASGQVAVAPLKAAYGVPFMYSPYYNLDPARGELEAYGRVVENGGSAGTIGPTYDSIESLEEAQVFPSIDGFTSTWRPNGVDILTSWRPTRYQPSGSFEGAQQLSDEAATATMHFPPVCGSDVAEFKSFYNGLSQWNKKVIDPVSINAAFVSYTGVSATDNTNLRYACQRISTNYANSSLHEDDEILIACWSGLPLSTVIGNVEFVINIEALVESRAFNTSATKPRTPGSVPMAILAAQAGAPSHPGYHNDTSGDGRTAAEHHLDERREAAVHPVAEVIGSAIDTAKSVVSGVGQAAEIAADIAGVIGMLF